VPRGIKVTRVPRGFKVTCVPREFKFRKIDISPIKFQMVFRINKANFSEHPLAGIFITYMVCVFCDVGIKIYVLLRPVPPFKWLKMHK
jgi:hypothetical protein